MADTQSPNPWTMAALTTETAGFGDSMGRTATRRLSKRVTERSNALDLRSGVFTWKDPKRIARSLKQSAERSRRRKADAFRSSLSMLTFYINRAGRNLSAERRRVLTRAKEELRKQFGRGRGDRS